MSFQPAGAVPSLAGFPFQESPLPLDDALSIAALSSQYQGSHDETASRAALPTHQAGPLGRTPLPGWLYGQH